MAKKKSTANRKYGNPVSWSDMCRTLRIFGFMNGVRRLSPSVSESCWSNALSRARQSNSTAVFTARSIDECRKVGRTG
jgi:hypothetical protein